MPACNNPDPFHPEILNRYPLAKAMFNHLMVAFSFGKKIGRAERDRELAEERCAPEDERPETDDIGY